jgi:hypothetical protein
MALMRQYTSFQCNKSQWERPAIWERCRTVGALPRDTGIGDVCTRPVKMMHDMCRLAGDPLIGVAISYLTKHNSNKAQSMECSK